MHAKLWNACPSSVLDRWCMLICMVLDRLPECIGPVITVFFRSSKGYKIFHLVTPGCFISQI